MDRSGRWGIVLLLSALLFGSLPLIDVDPVNGDNGESWTYHTSYEIAQNLSSLAENHSNISEYTTAQELLGTRNISGNRTIPILFIGNRSDGDRKWIMLIGAHHGDEPDSAETVLGFAHHILPAIQQNTYSIDLFNSINIAILPVLNPYGLDMGTRFDENDEDPNRDYPFVPEDSTPNSDGIPLTTAGAHAVHSLAMKYPFSIALSYHSGSKGIFTPWGAEGIGSFTPDMNMFNDLGAVLSRASGTGLIHGPANEFGSLGYLRGAFDDHLYGSTFYSQYLSSPSHILPWSIATATVELSEGRGMNVDRLGNLDGINYPNGPDDGTVPMGIRMSLAACHLLVPEMEGSVIKRGYIGETHLTLRGAASYNITSMKVNNEGYDLSKLSSLVMEHDFLPFYNISFDMEIPDVYADHEIEITVNFDEDWDEMGNVTDPKISPQSELSLSRLENVGSDHLTWTIKGDEPAYPEGTEVQVVNITPMVQEAGRNATITLDIPEELGTPLSLYIHTQVDWNRETTWIPAENITLGIASYDFFTPLLEGEANVHVNLTTEKGNFNATSTMRLYPHVYLIEVVRTSEIDLNYRLMIGVDGSLGVTTIYYGISRSLSLGWDELGWTTEPAGIVASSYGPYLLDLDLSTIGGEVYLRVCNYPGTIETTQLLELDSDILITHPSARIENDTLIIGPSMISAKWDGLQEINPGNFNIDYRVEITNSRTGISFNHTLNWRSLDQMTEADREELERIAEETGIPNDRLTGCWMGNIEAPEEFGNYTLQIHTIGQKLEHFDFDIQGFDIQLGSRESFSIEDDAEDDNGDRFFPTGVVILIVVIMAAIFILYVLRKGTNIKDKPDGTEGEEAPPHEEDKEE